MKYFFFILIFYVLISTFIICYISTIKKISQPYCHLTNEADQNHTNPQIFCYENNFTDYQRLINLTRFKYILDTEPCTSNETLIMIIHSLASNFDKRMAIRNTWGSKSSFPHKFIFALGVDPNSTIQELINKESNEYKDIIQGNFIESYRNLTYKHVMVLKWIYYNCNRIKFVIKVDDDVYIHIGRFLNKFLPSIPKLNTIACLMYKNGRVDRSEESKWRVSPDEYAPNTYPDYCAGWLVIYAGDTIEKLYKEAQKNKYFFIDDVLITGIYAEKLNISRVPIKASYILPTWSTFKRRSQSLQRIAIFLYNVNAEEITKLWNIAH